MRKPANAVKIGTGLFTNAYRDADGSVLLCSTDGTKECNSLGWYPKSPRFLKLEQLGLDDRDDLAKWYRCDYVGKFEKKAVTAQEWKVYKALRTIECKPGWHNSDLIAAFQALAVSFDLVPEIAEACNVLIEAVDALASYGDDVRFEISPRNLGARDGSIVFLDVFFLAEAREREYTRLAKGAAARRERRRYASVY